MLRFRKKRPKAAQRAQDLAAAPYGEVPVGDDPLEWLEGVRIVPGSHVQLARIYNLDDFITGKDHAARKRREDFYPQIDRLAKMLGSKAAASSSVERRVAYLRDSARDWIDQKELEDHVNEGRVATES